MTSPPPNHMPPSRITDHRDEGVLEVVWPDGAVGRLRHGLLRQRCRCAQCEQQRRRGAGPQPPDPALRVAGIEPVGDHGLNLRFSDGHGRGIYPWALLRELSTP